VSQCQRVHQSLLGSQVAYADGVLDESRRARHGDFIIDEAHRDAVSSQTARDTQTLAAAADHHRADVSDGQAWTGPPRGP
jgi:hypothetical protein